MISSIRVSIHAACVFFLLMATMANPVSALGSPMVRPRIATVKGVAPTPPLPEPLMRLHVPDDRQRPSGESHKHRHTHASRGGLR